MKHLSVHDVYIIDYIFDAYSTVFLDALCFWTENVLISN